MSPAAAIPGYAEGQTIAALSSRGGAAARAVVRLSGPQAVQTASQVFESVGGQIETAESHTSHRGWLRVGKNLRCPCVLYLFRGPQSYTGQELVEFHLPGGTATVQLAMAALTGAGARAAEPGEFTLRAFLSGRLDLAQAEAVAAIISSQTDAQLRAANSLAQGELSRAVEKIQEELTRLIGNLEANIDFVDQDIEFVGAEQAATTVEQMKRELDDLLANALQLGDLEHEPRVVLAGWANVGKSTLLNALSGRNRAIVSGLAGTTRDVLTAPMASEQTERRDAEVLLVDAAGLCDTILDEVGLAARAAALEAVRRADLLLYVVDATAGISQDQWRTLEGLDRGLTVVVVNKIDLLGKERMEEVLGDVRRQRQEKMVAVSAKFGQGLNELRELIRKELGGLEMPVWQGRLALTGRGEDGLKQARQALERAGQLIRESPATERPELLAVELYEANAALGTITGQVTSEDVLEDIFSRFCVGK